MIASNSIGFNRRNAIWRQPLGLETYLSRSLPCDVGSLANPAAFCEALATNGGGKYLSTYLHRVLAVF